MDYKQKEIFLNTIRERGFYENNYVFWKIFSCRRLICIK